MVKSKFYNLDTDVTLSSNSDYYVSSEKAVKAYVDNNIPTVNNATLTIQKNGTTVNTFTANASSDVIANITVPTNNNQLTNGAGYITDAALVDYSKTADTVSAVVAGSTANEINVTKNGSTSTITINNVIDATNATKATQDASGNVIATTYATKSELSKTTIRIWS